MNAKVRLKKRFLFPLLLVPTLAVGALTVGYSMDWRTVDSGGITFASGGDYRLGATAGQPDPGILTGGNYRLTGGFWVSHSGGGCIRNPAWLCNGDVDGDGAVNPVDGGLVQANFCLASACTDEQLCQYDMDCDGQINPVDSGIVQSLFGTCDAPRDVCP